MPKYRFEFLEGTNLDEVNDIELPDDETAINEARRTARGIFIDGIFEDHLRLKWSVQVYRIPDNSLVKSIAFGDLLTEE